MPEAIKAALTTSLAPQDGPPANIQYMPPGVHRINASRGGKPVTLDIAVDASTAETLNAFLQERLTNAADGSDDRPFFDFNHEDREAAAWPTEFYWAGDDPQTGGVRAKVEWSGAGQTAITDKTFRRFSPTFIPDAEGRVTGSETNMGGLVNRAAFKTIQPLFAKSPTNSPLPSLPSVQNPTPPLRVFASSRETTASATQQPTNLHTSEPSNVPPMPTPNESPAQSSVAAHQPTNIQSSEPSNLPSEADFERLRTENQQLLAKLNALETEQANAAQARAQSHIDQAVNAGRIAPADESTKAFWLDSLIRDEPSAIKALESLPANPVLAKVTDGADPRAGALDQMKQQQQKLAAVRAANPTADFQTIFAKAQSEAPDLFR